jgi:hypothetical protein
MTTDAIVLMILILGTVWGGLAYFLYRAMKSEKRTFSENTKSAGH